MFYNKLFREAAVARRARPEPLDARLQVTAPHEWMVLAGLGLAFLALIAWGGFGSVERGLAVEAVLVQPGERYAVTSPASGNVIEVLAEVGDPLEAGQAIARIRLPEVERQARITRRLMAAVEDGMRRAEASPPAFREALLAAARNELGEIERLASESIVASRGGELTAHRLAPGQPVHAGETVAQVRRGSDGGGAWQAVAFVSSGEAAKLAAGMDAEVLVALPGQPGSGALPARVLEVSPRPVAAPDWLAALGLSTGGAPAHLLRLAVNDPSRLPLTDGALGTVRVVLGTQSPATLLLADGGA